MLLVVATLLVQALVNIARAPLGLETRKMLTARLELPAWRYGTPAAIGEYHDQLVARLRAHPSIEAAAVTDRLPLLDGEPVSTLTIAGRAAPRVEDTPWAVSTVVERTVLRRGRDCRWRRGAHSRKGPRGSAARGDREPGDGAPLLGVPGEGDWRTFHLHADAGRGPVEIVGVTGDVLRGDREGVNPQIYLAARQQPGRSIALVIRTSDPMAVAAILYGSSCAAWTPTSPSTTSGRSSRGSTRISRAAASSGACSCRSRCSRWCSPRPACMPSCRTPRRSASRNSACGFALGATSSDIVRMMLRQTGRLVAIGLVLGLLGGRALAMLATSLLYRVSPSDPATYAGVAGDAWRRSRCWRATCRSGARPRSIQSAALRIE